MSRIPTKYVCKLCGLGVCYYGNGKWRHNANMHTGKSCGKGPHVQLREEYEAEMTAIVDYVKGKKL